MSVQPSRSSSREYSTAGNRQCPGGRMVRGLISSIVFWVAILTTGVAHAELFRKGMHPQDGAHADVRIRIDETGVTYNVQINLVFMDFVAPVPRESFDRLDPYEEEPVRDAIIEFFRTKIKVVIDGVEVAPVLREYDFRRPGPELLPLFPRTGMRGLLKSHLILDYSAKSPPESVTMTWEGFPPDTFTYPDLPLEDTPPLVLKALLTAEGVDKLIDFTTDENEYTWHSTGETLADRFLAVPQAPSKPTSFPLPILSIGLFAVSFILISVAPFLGGRRSNQKTPAATAPPRRALLYAAPIFLIAAGLTLHVGTIEITNPFDDGHSLPSEVEAVEIFAPLHANIYRAFDYTVKGEIYDALARSVDGPLLDALYSEIYRSLIMQDEGGALSRVKSVNVLETEVTSIGYFPPENIQPSFTLSARWRVEGFVYHSGHSHTRLNEYAAEYTVVSTADGWRIASSRVTEQFRVEIDAGGAENDVEDEPTLDLLPGEDI